MTLDANVPGVRRGIRNAFCHEKEAASDSREIRLER
jgi:hypothetical protein